MRILLDEDVPRQLKREMTGHDVSTVGEVGRSGIRNGVLLDLAADSGFELFLTCDQNLPHQQNVPALRLALIVVAVPKTKLETLCLLVPDMLEILQRNLQPRSLHIVGRSFTS